MQEARERRRGAPSEFSRETARRAAFARMHEVADLAAPTPASLAELRALLADHGTDDPESAHVYADRAVAAALRQALRAATLEEARALVQGALAVAEVPFGRWFA